MKQFKFHSSAKQESGVVFTEPGIILLKLLYVKVYIREQRKCVKTSGS